MGMVDIASYVFGKSVGFPWTVGFAHLLAAALLPWSPRQAVFPVALLLAVNALTIFVFGDRTLAGKTALSVVSIAAGVPGSFMAMLRHSRRVDRFKLRFLQSRYGQIRRELTDARRIHESLFPKPLSRGALRFDYRYEPMRQIGGDYFYAKFSPPLDGQPAAFNAILIDVTGHGIAAALTVNRLYGEVERLFAEVPNASPGDVLRALNRYVFLTMANHSIFATALCTRIDPGVGEIEFASGGHPPAFLRAVDGTLDQLPSTAFVLGACADDEFDPAPEKRRFGPGDTLIAYTDGAIEARNDSGRMLGVIGIERLLATIAPAAAGGWSAAIVAAVDSHRCGPANDDTLVVEVYRPLNLDTDPGKATRTRSRDSALV
jgi:serine phosphatase RsbU (regulator of sigma subunit)